MTGSHIPGAIVLHEGFLCVLHDVDVQWVGASFAEQPLVGVRLQGFALIFRGWGSTPPLLPPLSVIWKTWVLGTFFSDRTEVFSAPLAHAKECSRSMAGLYAHAVRRTVTVDLSGNMSWTCIKGIFMDIFHGPQASFLPTPLVPIKVMVPANPFSLTRNLPEPVPLDARSPDPTDSPPGSNLMNGVWPNGASISKRAGQTDVVNTQHQQSHGPDTDH